MPGFDPSCIDVEDYLECLEMQNVDRATEKEFRFSCPLPAHATGDENPSAYMNIETTAFFCHSCHAKGNAVTLAAQILDVSPVIATRMLRQRYSPAGIDPDSRNMEEEIRRLIESRKKPDPRRNKVLDESVLGRYKVDWPTRFAEWHEGAAPEWVDYLLGERGFEPEILMDWEFGYSKDKNRITLPVRDEDGDLVGIKARAYDDETKPKYLNLRDPNNDIEAFLKNEIVFGLYLCRQDEPLIVVEGEFNVIAMQTLGYNCGGVNGSYFGDRQIQLIKRWTDHAILFFDSDRAGWDATNSVAETLNPFIRVDICPDHHGDPMVMHPYSIRKCLQEARSWTELLMSA